MDTSKRGYKAEEERRRLREVVTLNTFEKVRFPEEGGGQASPLGFRRRKPLRGERRAWERKRVRLEESRGTTNVEETPPKRGRKGGT